MDAAIGYNVKVHIVTNSCIHILIVTSELGLQKKHFIIYYLISITFYNLYLSNYYKLVVFTVVDRYKFAAINSALHQLKQFPYQKANALSI